ncbi:hypothetical protein NDU88_000463 [Pleurodeles waltl]|uniref:Uncharacterized protein n=1 Tax=Pleurodeles waltl TaxID=8319 RepID=A0AAV7WI96_PLEWA|nr:hypothetical protein NDU88_000463 [Pleurodeles waltl]
MANRMTRAGIGATPMLGPTQTREWPGRWNREKQRRLTGTSGGSQRRERKQQMLDLSPTRRRGRRRTLAYPDLVRTAGSEGEEQRAPSNGSRGTGIRKLTAPRPIGDTAARNKHIGHWILIKPGRVDKGWSAAPLYYTHKLNIRSKSVCHSSKPIPC